MPQQQFGGQYLHEGLAAMAAAYLFHIAQNHAFHDGNKRTAALAALVFLDVNGVEALPAPDALEEMTMRVATLVRRHRAYRLKEPAAGHVIVPHGAE